MLNIVVGRSGFGKTQYVINKIKALIDSNEQGVLLFTPEQNSLIAEAKLFNALGEKDFNKVSNLSFSRLKNLVDEEFGHETLPVLSNGGKTILMARAIDKSKENLELFNKNIDSFSFVSSMMNVYDEMRSCNLSSSEIVSLSRNIDNNALNLKLNDIALIMKNYDDIIKDKFLDPANELLRLYSKLLDKNYFSNKEIFMDGFNGFVANEYKLMELMIDQSKNMTITFCTDLKSLRENDELGLFAYVNKTIGIIEKIAKKANVEVNFVELSENYRCNKELSFLEKNIYNDELETSQELPQNIEIYRANTITDECNNVARNIKKLLRNGYRANEITVITRDMATYQGELKSAFKRFEVPYFNDEREAITTQPLVIFINYLLRVVNNSFKSDDVLSLLKTGLTYIDDSEISDLENYVYIWNINSAKKWQNDFENSARGLSKFSEIDAKNLDKINTTRKKVVGPIINFKNACKSKNAKDICSSIYDTLLAFGVDQKVKENAIFLAQNNHISLANEQNKIWELVMNVLDQMATTLTELISLKDFEKLFSLIIKSETLGVIPAGLDNVQFGQADRIRCDNPKAVFVVGANEDEFPLIATKSGILSETDRQIMIDNDFKLYSDSSILTLQERYFAYMAMTCASKKLFVSFGGGSQITESSIVLEIKKVYPTLKIKNYRDFENIDLIESLDSAYDLACNNYFVNDEFSQSLKEFIKESEKASQFESLSFLINREEYKITSSETAKALFKKDMFFSPSSIENFYNCKFQYFCKVGLGAKKLRKAEINPMERGTLIHYILENILKEYGSDAIKEYSDKELKKLVDLYLDKYFQEEFKGVKDFSNRFSYNYYRLKYLVYNVVISLANEYRVSDYKASAFELSIGDDASVKAPIYQLEDGSIKIRGSIDRVDTYEENGQKYIRIVDYKTGSKSLNLNDVVEGLNLQMFIYLFSLAKDKTSEFSGIPTGVLYKHASDDMINYDYYSSVENYEDDKQKNLKMNGLIIENSKIDVIDHMEKMEEGQTKCKYIPVGYTSKGGFDQYSSVATLEQLGFIERKIDDLVAKMGNAVHNGEIEQNPAESSSHKDICDYCDFKSVCANRIEVTNREIESKSNKEVLSELSKLEEGGE